MASEGESYHNAHGNYIMYAHVGLKIYRELTMAGLFHWYFLPPLLIHCCYLFVVFLYYLFVFNLVVNAVEQ